MNYQYDTPINSIKDTIFYAYLRNPPATRTAKGCYQ